MIETEEQIERAREDYVEGKIGEYELEECIEVAHRDDKFHIDDFLCDEDVFVKNDGWLYFGNEYVRDNEWVIQE